MTPADFPDMDDILNDLFERGPSLSFKQVDREMEKRAREYNERPQKALGGLSPDQLYRLLNGDWISQGPLRLNESLSFAELSGAPFFLDARTLLDYATEHEPLEETPARNLKRADVAALRPQLLSPANKLISRNHYLTNSRNEVDLPWLYELRQLLLIGKLLTRRKGIRITTRGLGLLIEDRAGQLYAHLFRTLFRVFDLSYLDGATWRLALQSTAAFTMYRLQTVAREWTTPQELVSTAWLHTAEDPQTTLDPRFRDHDYIFLQHRILDPLFLFGLWEIRPAQGDGAGYRDVEYRCTPLYSRFLSFDFGRE